MHAQLAADPWAPVSADDSARPPPHPRGVGARAGVPRTSMLTKGSSKDWFRWLRMRLPRRPLCATEPPYRGWTRSEIHDTAVEPNASRMVVSTASRRRRRRHLRGPQREQGAVICCYETANEVWSEL